MMESKVHFSEEELAIAKQVSLTAVAKALGYTVYKIGRYHTLKEMDSMRIYDDSHWYRWSRKGEKDSGGSQIDFLRVFAGMDVKEAVFWLLDFAGYSHSESKIPKSKLMHQISEKKMEKKEFVLPDAALDNSRIYDYLQYERGISKDIIDYFVKRGLIYESKGYHNVVFKGNDKNGVTKFASLRGICDHYGKSFKCDVAGNDKNYGFNVWNDESKELVVFEAAIDLMSYLDIFRDFDANMLALGMVGDAPIETFLKEHPQIKTIIFCLDRDKAGRDATVRLMEKYQLLGYQVEDKPVIEGYKDYNEWLVDVKSDVRNQAIEETKTR